jgi:hypothetical protein
MKLEELRLGWNHIGSAGATALAKALQSNTSLSLLDLQHNHIAHRPLGIAGTSRTSASGLAAAPAAAPSPSDETEGRAEGDGSDATPPPPPPPPTPDGGDGVGSSPKGHFTAAVLALARQGSRLGDAHTGDGTDDAAAAVLILDEAQLEGEARELVSSLLDVAHGVRGRMDALFEVR